MTKPNYSPGDLITEVVVWEVVKFDQAAGKYLCREKKGQRTRHFKESEVGLETEEVGIHHRSS